MSTRNTKNNTQKRGMTSKFPPMINIASSRILEYSILSVLEFYKFKFEFLRVLSLKIKIKNVRKILESRSFKK